MHAILCSLAFKEAVWHQTTNTILARTWQQNVCQLMTIHSIFKKILNIHSATYEIILPFSMQSDSGLPGLHNGNRQTEKTHTHTEQKIGTGLLASYQQIGD